MSSTLQRALGGVPAPQARSAPPWSRWSGLLPWLLAVLTIGLACALPLAPVVVDTPTVRWPLDAASPSSTQALFMPYRPIDVSAAVPCATARSVGARTATGAPAVLVGTALADAPRGQQRSLFVTVSGSTVRVLSSGRLLWSGPVPAPAGAAQDAAGCSLVVRADQSASGVRVVVPGRPDAVLAAARGAAVPEVVAFTTDATAADGPSPSAVAHPDARFQSRPTPLKTALLVLDVLALLACLLTLRRGDAAPARQGRLVVPAGRPALRAVVALADVAVVATLAGWTLAGPIQTDDYYYSLEARTLGVAGYVGNQIRYFNVPEIPFVLEQTLLAPLASLSASPLVLRLPSLAAGLVVWWLLTRSLLPLLVERPHPALRWVAAAALLAWWLPWDIGVRPEALVALCWTLTLTFALQAVRRRRAWLVGAAALVAGLAVTVTASGLSCALTLLVLLPRLWPVLRASRAGAWASLALAVACASVASTVVFADATLAGALTALRVHTEVGPDVPWWQEPVRYWYLTVGPDPNQHSAARQVAVLTTLAVVVGTSITLLRVTRAPARRTGWAVTALAYLAANAALVPTPTKWSHHFGALAAPGALAMTVAVAVLLRRRPDRWSSGVLLGAVAVTAGVAFHGGNNQVEYSAYAVRRTLPAVLGNPGLWLAAGLATAGVVVLLRRRRGIPDGGPDGERVGDRPAGPWPEAVVGALAAVLVTALAVQVGSVALASWRLRHTWSMAGDSFATLAGRTGCGFADTAVALTDPRVLPAVPGAAAPVTASAPGTAPAALPPGLDPAGLRAAAPAGSAVRSTWQPGPAGRSTQVETPWLATTALTRQDVLAVAVTGVPGPGVVVLAQYGTTAANGSVRPGTTARVAVRAPADPARPAWSQVVLAAGGTLPAGADAVRLRVTDDGAAPDAWVAATDPYRVVGHRLSALLPHDGGVVVDWPLGFDTPCFRPPAVVDGMVEPARWLVQSATFANTPPLTVIDGGGSYATAPTVSTATSWPGFTPGVTPYTSWGNLVRWTPRLPAHGFRLEHSTRVVPGWRWWPGAGPGPSPDRALG